MKYLLLALCVGHSLHTLSQEDKAVDLSWKVAKGEPLVYTTIMSEIDSASTDMELESLFKAFPDSSDTALQEKKEFINRYTQVYKNLDYITTLSTEKGDVIDIVMTSVPTVDLKHVVDDSTLLADPGFLQALEARNNEVVLRGSVYPSGEIHSFWVRSNQKNLIALFFQLPTEPVKIGDKWPLTTHLINNDHNFQCDSAYYKNEVSLVDINTVEGVTIATITYDIVEYVQGRVKTISVFQGDFEEVLTKMSFSYQATAEFSIDQGRWITYDGILSLTSSGALTVSKKTRYALLEK